MRQAVVRALWRDGYAIRERGLTSENERQNRPDINVRAAYFIYSSASEN